MCASLWPPSHPPLRSLRFPHNHPQATTSHTNAKLRAGTKQFVSRKQQQTEQNNLTTCVFWANSRCVSIFGSYRFASCLSFPRLLRICPDPRHQSIGSETPTSGSLVCVLFVRLASVLLMCPVVFGSRSHFVSAPHCLFKNRACERSCVGSNLIPPEKPRARTPLHAPNGVFRFKLACALARFYKV